MHSFDNIRQEFPFFSGPKATKPSLIYFDNAATTQKPRQVLEALDYFYSYQNANVHRAVYDLSAQATAVYEQARESIRSFINAKKAEEIIFTKGTTEAINLVARSYLAPRLQAGDNVIVSLMEHHSNFVPWQQLCMEKQAELRILPVDKDGVLVMSRLNELLDERTKMLALVQLSNSIGTINPVQEIINQAHARSVPILVDGAQSVSRQSIDIQLMGADFFVFSGHKLFGPTGIGVLYAKEKHLQEMSPYQFGGDMVRQVKLDHTTFKEAPQRFEAGTPNIAGAIGLAAAVRFVQELGADRIMQNSAELTAHAWEALSLIEGIKLYGSSMANGGIIAFNLENIHPHDVATILNEQGIAIRAGHHCCQPLMSHLGIPGSCRLSFSIYNTKDEIDTFIGALHAVKSTFR